MNADVAQLAGMLAIANTVALLLMVPLSIIGSAFALNKLEEFDSWLSRRDAIRAPAQIDKNVPPSAAG